MFRQDEISKEKSIGEAILNALQQVQSSHSTEGWDLVTPPQDDLRADDEDDGILHLTGTDLQTGEILRDTVVVAEQNTWGK